MHHHPPPPRPIPCVSRHDDLDVTHTRTQMHVHRPRYSPRVWCVCARRTLSSGQGPRRTQRPNSGGPLGGRGGGERFIERRGKGGQNEIFHTIESCVSRPPSLVVVRARAHPRPTFIFCFFTGITSRTALASFGSRRSHPSRRSPVQRTSPQTILRLCVVACEIDETSFRSFRPPLPGKKKNKCRDPEILCGLRKT